MPPLPAPGSIIRCEVKYGIDASIEAGSRFFLRYTSPAPSAQDLNELAGNVAGVWTTTMAPVTSSAEALHGVVCTDLSSASGNQGDWTGTQNGQESGAQLPASACGVVNHIINRRYRGGRPRTYIRCGTQADLTGTNEWSATFQATLLTKWEAWINGILTDGGGSLVLQNIVNVSWYEGFTVFTGPTGRARNIPTLRTTPLVDQVQSSTVSPKLGSQRRRLNL